MLPDGVVAYEDGVNRCWWCGEDPLYITYHDEEWGRRVVDDVRLFEKICLEGFQSGLSWLTILRKRENFRRAFDGFDIARVAAFGPRDVARLMGDAGIVRHRGKIEAAICNARLALELITEHGSIAKYVDCYAAEASSRPSQLTQSYLADTTYTSESKAMSRDLKRRGWRFVGPTTVYSFMQAMGVVNDHLSGCSIRDACG